MVPAGGQRRLGLGYGAEAAAAEAFVASFSPALSTSRLSLFGDDVRIHHCWGGPWQVHYVWPNGRGDLLVAAEGARPRYDRLLALIKRVPGSRASRPWTELLGISGGGGGGRGGSGGAGPASAAAAAAAAAAEEEQLLLPSLNAADLAAAAARRRSVDVAAATTAATSDAESSSSSSVLDLSAAAAATAAARAAAREAAQVAAAAAAAPAAPAKPQASELRFADVDIVTGAPVRDVRYEPLLQFSRWFSNKGGGGGGSGGGSRGASVAAATSGEKKAENKIRDPSERTTTAATARAVSLVRVSSEEKQTNERSEATPI